MITPLNLSPDPGLLSHLISILQPELILEFKSSWHIVIHESPDKSLASCRTLFNAATEGRFENIPPYCFHSVEQLRAGLDTGNIWYNALLINGTQLYSNNKHQLPEPLPKRLHRVHQDCEGQFAIGLQKSDAFRDGAEYYHKKGDPGMAAFMLHQCLELLLHYLSQAVTGRQTRSHCLKDNLQFCRHFASELYDHCLDQETHTVQSMILHLNKAYSAYRYSQHFTIDSEKVAQLLSHSRQLREIAVRLLQQLLFPFHNALYPGGINAMNHSSLWIQQPTTDF